MRRNAEHAESPAGLEEKTGYVFSDRVLLRQALTHSSYLNEHPGETAECNERLEFLGDAVLEAVSSDVLFRAYPEKDEGELTQIRAELVCEEALSADAARIGLSGYLFMGKGEEMTGGREKPSVCADAMEALIGAVYLDGGMEEARGLISRFVLDDLEKNRRFTDAKTALQEMAQRLGKSVEYRTVSEEGPPHRRVYTVEALVDGVRAGGGTGSGKKAAQQEAAKDAISSWKEG